MSQRDDAAEEERVSRSRTAFVTGASGFLGAHLVRGLLGDGWSVRALVRSPGSARFLRGLDCEVVQGDVTDALSLRRTMPAQVDAVFHLAASTNLWRRRNQEQFQINVAGTRHLVEAALGCKARRFVHTSSTLAFGPVNGDVLREDQASRAEGHWVNYFRTKRLAELEVHAGVKRGLDAVILNPGNVLGPYDANNWARFFRLVLDGMLPAVLPGSAPFTHVASVVRAQLAAFERGRSGEHYLLGAVSASYAELAREVAVSGRGRLPPTAPGLVLRALGRWNELVAGVTGRFPDLTPEAVHLTSLRYSCDTNKAASELDYRETSLRRMVEDTYVWMQRERHTAWARHQALGRKERMVRISRRSPTPLSE